MTKIYEYTCHTCLDKFKSKYKKAKYCSQECFHKVKKYTGFHKTRSNKYFNY